MNMQPNAGTESAFEPQGIAPAVMTATRPLYWSVQRELWENRSIYIAPLIAAAIGAFAFLISLIHLPRELRELAAHEPAHPHIDIIMPYGHVSWLLIVTAFIVGVFYCLDALYGERRDRSILFWKSLPVSDLTTILAKASIPLVILPLVVFAIAVVVELLMFLLSTVVLVLSGVGPAALWNRVPFFQMVLALLYVLIALALWHAPIYAWLLLVSAWARRTTFLWAVLPVLAVAALERMALHSSHFARLLHNRLFGFAPLAFAFKLPDNTTIDPHFIPLSQVTPARLLSSPGLWGGLVFAAIFLAAAVRLRRYREPI